MNKLKLFTIILGLIAVLLPAKYAYSRSRVLPNSPANLTVSNGTRLILNLEGNQTTGYRWMVKLDPEDTKVLEVTEGVYEADDSGLIGAGGTYKFIIKAREKGEAKIVAQYNRSWEEKPLNVIEYNITVE